MKLNLQKLGHKKRAVSPVIAAILLIGLAVLAGAAIFGVVLPLLNQGPTADNLTVTVDNFTVDDKNGGGNQQKTITFTISITNSGTAAVDLTQVIFDNDNDGNGNEDRDFEWSSGTMIGGEVGGTGETGTIKLNNAGGAVQSSDIRVGIGGINLLVEWTTSLLDDWGTGAGGVTWDWQLLITFGGSIGQLTFDTNSVLTFVTI